MTLPATLHRKRAGQLSRRDAAELLARAGCAMCHRMADAERDFFAWFAIETHTLEPMRAALGRSLGFCPDHTRRLLAEAAAPGVLTGLGPRLAGAALERLGGERPLALCPACETLVPVRQSGLRLISEALDRRDLARRYEQTGGLCHSHLRQALAALPARHVARLIATWQSAPDAGVAHDADASSRRRLRAALQLEDDESGNTVQRLSKRLGLACCPACLAAGRDERRFLEWAASDDGLDDHALQTAMDLCERHFTDLSALSPARAQRLHEIRTPRRREVLERFERRAAAHAGRRLRRPLGSRSLAEARDEMAMPPACPACHSFGVQETRAVELVVEAVADRSVRAAYEQAHGLCVRHLRGLAPDAPAVLRETAVARLRVLRWELVEDFRKRRWDARHEPPGPEQRAWLRLPALLDGRTFLGGAPSEYDDVER